MKKSADFNPYNDGRIHITKPDESYEPLDDRKGFNAAMDHYDIINGHQIPKKMAHLPRSLRKVVRPLIIVWVAAFAILTVWEIITLIKQSP